MRSGGGRRPNFEVQTSQTCIRFKPHTCITFKPHTCIQFETSYLHHVQTSHPHHVQTSRLLHPVQNLKPASSSEPHNFIHFKHHACTCACIHSKLHTRIQFNPYKWVSMNSWLFCTHFNLTPASSSVPINLFLVGFLFIQSKPHACIHFKSRTPASSLAGLRLGCPPR